MRTLGDVAAYMSALTEPSAPPEVKPQQPLETPTTVQPVPASQPEPVAISQDEVTKAFLEIVSEKTGYPVEMLELDMELEADLGIDLIKRVEILGAMQANYPELAKIDPANLAELRTLRQIIESLAAPAPSE